MPKKEIDESILRRQVSDFFTDHEAGKYLNRLWRTRIDKLKKDLIWEKDPARCRTVQAILQYHEQVIDPEMRDLIPEDKPDILELSPDSRRALGLKPGEEPTPAEPLENLPNDQLSEDSKEALGLNKKVEA